MLEHRIDLQANFSDSTIIIITFKKQKAIIKDSKMTNGKKSVCSTLSQYVLQWARLREKTINQIGELLLNVYEHTQEGGKPSKKTSRLVCDRDADSFSTTHLPQIGSQGKCMVAGNTDIGFKIAFPSNEQHLHSSHKYVTERERLADVKSHERECWSFPREYSFERAKVKRLWVKEVAKRQKSYLWVRRPGNPFPVLLKVFCMTKFKKPKPFVCLIQPYRSKAVEFHYLHAYLQKFIWSK